ncbi:pyrroline-5-carboxylate reductase dimerization domain-containing protein [Methanobacterium sp. ACI-7]|uniref:pyrroline-5-carboxylate reductase dimerization domain-containing protein n=1 Tax=unclassified Methanobacterium TaxID=2627676 RepID=UPI0039C30B37
MNKIGFIGYGSMGSMIINGLLNSSSLEPKDIIISNRSFSKLQKIKNKYPEIEITSDYQYVASKCDRIFIFVGTFAVKEIIENIIELISDKTHIIHISAGLTMENVESVFDGKITKVIPSLTSKVNDGVSLINHNEKVTNDDAEFVNKIFKTIGSTKIISENDFEVGSDLTSCAPAFIASIFMQFAEAGVRHGNFTIKEAEEMVAKTLYGTAKLIYEEKISFKEIISRVATPGGITEEGVKILEKNMPQTFDEIFKTTLNKHEKIKTELDKQYKN